MREMERRSALASAAQQPNATVGAVPACGIPRPRVVGKFLFVGEQKLWVRGVTYGTFRPRDGCDYPDRARVSADFAAMAAAGFNAVRVYSVPPEWLLDEALLRRRRKGPNFRLPFCFQRTTAQTQSYSRTAAPTSRRV